MADDEPLTALKFSSGIKDGIKKKATINKWHSNILYFVILFSTALAPVLILLPWGVNYSKILPALMSASAALATFWLHLRKPQERWIIYRGAQREIEHEINQYTFENGDYVDKDKKDKLLAERVNDRALQLHYEWVPFAPKADEIEKILKPKKEKPI